jgi:hypothetical protein
VRQSKRSAAREIQVVQNREAREVEGGGVGAFLAEIGGGIVRGARWFASNTCTNPYCSCKR